MTLKVTKTYTNGAKHTAIINDRDHDAYVARINEEDAAAGLVGVWDGVIYRVNGVRTNN